MRTETVAIPEHTVTTTYYEYDELSDSAKEKVKQWYLDTYRWTEDFSYDVKCDLENLFGKNDLKVEYSLNYSQGDGLNVYGKIDAKAILDCLEKHNGGTQFEKYENVLTDAEKQTILEYQKWCHLIELPSNDRRYCYCMADMVDLASNWAWDLDGMVVDIDTDLLYKFENLVIDMFTGLCKTYKEWGYEFFYEVSDEEMCENCEANEWEFDEDGNLL